MNTCEPHTYHRWCWGMLLPRSPPCNPYQQCQKESCLVAVSKVNEACGFARGENPLFMFASIPLIESTAFVPYRPCRDVSASSCFSLTFHLSSLCISFVYLWNSQVENIRTISLQLGKIRFSEESIKDVSFLLFWLPEMFLLPNLEVINWWKCYFPFPAS